MQRNRRERRFERAPFGANVELWRNRAPRLLKAADISPGGLFLRTDEPLDEGAYLTLRIALPGEPRFSALCRVARVQAEPGRLHREGLGLEFLDVRPSDRARIEAYVSRTLGFGLSAVA